MSREAVRIVSLSRRDLFRTGGAFVLAVQAWDGAAASPAFTPNAFIAMESDGNVTLTITRSEMGQGIRTTLAMIMADEMAANWSRIQVRQADGDPRFGDQDTDASRSVRSLFKPLRVAGATARRMLEAAAAQVWRASTSECRAVDHEVIHVPTGRYLEFGELAKIAAALPVPPPDRVRPKDFSSRRYVGHTMPSLDLAAMIHAKPLYAGDMVAPGLRYASVQRCPVYGGTVKTFNADAALQVHGVVQVIAVPPAPLPTGHLPLGGVAVIATNFWAADQGRRKLVIEWDLGPNAAHDSTAFRAELEAAAAKPGRVVRNIGLVDAALAVAATRLQAEYFVPYHAAATMETPVAVAIPGHDRLTVFAPTQNPQGARTVVAGYLGVREADITVTPTFLGNGFGRKDMHDFVCEAAFLARALHAPVKLTWTREDDLRMGYYHPAAVQRLEGGMDKNGVPVGWRHRSIFPSVAATFHADQTVPDAAQQGQGLIDMPLAIPAIRCEIAGAPAHLRLASLRGGMNVQHAFAASSFIDEMASAAGKDPYNFLFTNLAGPRKLDLKAQGVDYPNYGAAIEDFPLDVGRLQNVLSFVFEKAEWAEPLLPRQGRGLAVHRSYLSYVAGVAVVSVAEDGKVTVPRFDIAIDCGQAINPDRIRALMEDQIMYGIGLTLFNAITVKGGAVEASNFDSYLQARIDHAPEIHVYITNTTEAPGGVGDAAVPVVAPAICNAIFAATGQRIRALPVDAALLKEGAAPTPTAVMPGLPPAPSTDPAATPSKD